MASITKRPNGKWRARYRDASGEEHARHFDRKVDGQRWLDEVTASIVTGQYVDPEAGRVTFATFYAEWSPRQVWEPTTVDAMGLAARSVTFADVPLSRLRRSHLETWIKGMDSRGLAPGTIRTRVNNVRAVLSAAVRDRVIARNPSDGLVLPRARRREAAMVIPTTRQVAAVLRACDDSFRALVAVAAFAGLRLGEAAALQVGDVQYLRRSLQVQRQVQRLKGGLVDVRLPKYGSERTVYVSDELLDMLSAHVAGFVTSDDPARWMFSSSGTDPWHQNTVYYYWRKACRRADVTGMTFHSLRHFYASGLIADGCDVVTVQRALGHAKATTTLNTYAHLWPSAEDRTRAASGALARQVLGIPADHQRTARGL